MKKIFREIAYAPIVLMVVLGVLFLTSAELLLAYMTEGGAGVVKDIVNKLKV